MKKIVVTFGRLNPSTTGHQKLADKLLSVAKQNNATARIYLSHTQNNKKDPLNYADKIKYAKKAFGNIVTKSNAKTIIEVAKELEEEGFTDLIVVVGSDRIPEFKRLLEKYNGSDYTFDSIEIVSAGERDPDADDVSGMSASKVRKFAMEGDYKNFASGMPSKLSDKDKKEIYDKIRSTIKEETEIEEDEMDEERKPLTLQQRQKRARMLKRIAPKLARFREIRKKRMADQPRLVKRSRKLAIKMLRKRVAGDRGANYAELSPTDKISVDKLVMKKMGMINKIAQRLLPKVRKAEMERVKKARETVKEEKVPQDPDVKSREGTQPKKYFSGLKKDIKARRDAQFKAGAEKDSGDPSAYPEKHAGDAGVETKPSKHTLKYKRMFGENEQQQKAKEAIQKEKELDKQRFDRMMDRARSADTTLKNKQTEEVNLDELSYEGNIGAMEVAKFYKIADTDQKKELKEFIRQKKFREAWQLVQKVTKEKLQGKEFGEEFDITESAEAALRKKAEKSGISYGTLKKVYDRGMAAWRTGHRPGATQQQWAFARVNSYITKGKGTYHGADKDLREDDVDEASSPAQQAAIAIAMKKAGKTPKNEEGGAGEEGTNKLVKKYFRDTPFSKMVKEEPCCDDCADQFDHIVEETEYEGRKVKLNDPFRTPGGPKKFSVYVKNEKGNVVKVNFGDPNMEIKRDDPARRASFRARHGCDNPGPKWKAKYWSCYQWRAGAKVEN
jgi:nicotinic acid mononucleotide adenylyltransferase